MKTLKFSEEEISLLRNLYQDELAQAKSYISQIKDVLKKLGAPSRVSKEVEIEKEPKVAKKRGRKPKAKAIAPVVTKKRGRPKVVSTTIEAATIKVTKPAKKAKPKKKVATKPKIKAVKKPVATHTPKPEPVVMAELIPTPKVIKKVVKKKVTKKRRPKGISLVSLRKPLPKKEPVIESEPKSEPVPAIEPIVTPKEEPQE
jgi:ribosome-binding protein aMBF1 (putative translation factor)